MKGAWSIDLSYYYSFVLKNMYIDRRPRSHKEMSVAISVDTGRLFLEKIWIDGQSDNITSVHQSALLKWI